MNQNFNLKTTKKVINTLLFFLILLALYFQKFYIEIGFGLKPFMFILGSIILFYILFNFKVVNRIYLYEKFIILFFLYSIIRGCFSVDKINYIRLSLGFVIVFLLYFFVSNIVYNIDKKAIIRIIYYVSIIFILFSLILYFGGDKKNGLGGEMDRGMYRLTGTIIDPNIFALFGTLIYGISLHKVIENKKKKFLISLFLIMICFLFTFSRGGIIGLVFFTVIYFISFTKINLKIIIKLIIIFAILVLIIFLFAKSLNINLLEILNQRSSIKTGSGRLKIWSNGIKLFKQNPFFGIGLYNFQNYNIRIFNDSHYLHNTFLAVLVENGLMGSLMFFLFLISFIFKKGNQDIEKVIKLIIYGQLVMLFFLSGIINEFLYFTFAIYKGLKLKTDI